MPGPPAHDFRDHPEYRLEMQAAYFLALVDLESYPAFIAAQADRFDLIQHLCAQRDALTATFWEVPPTLLRLQIKWAPDEGLNNALIRSGPPLATGVVRTGGRLGLIEDGELLAMSRQQEFLADSRETNYRQMQVTPGIYSVSVFNSPLPEGDAPEANPGYAVILTHHPHPAPRQRPIRLNAHRPFGGTGPLDHIDSTQDSHDSHKMPT